MRNFLTVSVLGFMAATSAAAAQVLPEIPLAAGEYTTLPKNEQIISYLEILAASSEREVGS